MIGQRCDRKPQSSPPDFAHLISPPYSHPLSSPPYFHTLYPTPYLTSIFSVFFGHIISIPYFTFFLHCFHPLIPPRPVFNPLFQTLILKPLFHHLFPPLKFQPLNSKLLMFQPLKYEFLMF